MKTKDELVKTTLKSETGFKLSVIELLADIRNLFIAAFLSDDSNSTHLKKIYEGAYKEMRRLLTEESKDKDNKS